MSRIITRAKVPRVDLVRRGANRKEFFLKKGEDMSDFTDDQLQAMLVTIANGQGWDEERLFDGVKEVEKSEINDDAKLAVVAALRLLTKHVQGLPKGLQRAVGALHALSKTEKGASLEKSEYKELLESPVQKIPVQIRREDGTVDPLKMDVLTAQLIKGDGLAKEVKDLLEGLSDSNKSLAKAATEERLARLRKEYVAKAETLDGLPVSAEELAGMLMWLSKSVDISTEAKALANLLPACDAAMKELKLTVPYSVVDSPAPGLSGELLQKAAEGENQLLEFITKNPAAYNRYVDEQRRRSVAMVE